MIEARRTPGDRNDPVVPFAARAFFPVLLEAHDRQGATLNNDARESRLIEKDHGIEGIPVRGAGAWDEPPVKGVMKTSHQRPRISNDLELWVVLEFNPRAAR